MIAVKLEKIYIMNDFPDQIQNICSIIRGKYKEMGIKAQHYVNHIFTGQDLEKYKNPNEVRIGRENKYNNDLIKLLAEKIDPEVLPGSLHTAYANDDNIVIERISKNPKVAFQESPDFNVEARKKAIERRNALDKFINNVDKDAESRKYADRLTERNPLDDLREPEHEKISYRKAEDPHETIVSKALHKLAEVVLEW